MPPRQPLIRLLVLLGLAACLVAAAPAAAAPASGRTAAQDGRQGKAQPRRSERRKAARQRRSRARQTQRARRLLRRAKRRSPAVEGAVALGSPARPAPPGGDLLFDGSHISDFELLQAAPGAIAEVSDPLGSGGASFQMTVEDDDVYPVTPTDNPRAQALSPSLIAPGDEIWLRTRLMLPDDIPEVDGWMSLVSIYGPPFDGSSPWQIGVRGDELVWQRNETYGYDVPWRMPIVKGRWTEILLHERFAADGWVEMWIDGRQVSFFGGEQRLAMETMDSSNDGGANHAKIMQYRQAGMFDSATVYFGSLLLGRTRAAVGA